MTTTLIIGIDGSRASERALAHGKRLARLIGECQLLLVYVIEWTPFSFSSAEENAIRHRRRDEEIGVARSRILDPMIEALKADGLAADSLVKHGDPAEILNALALEHRAEQIVIARGSDSGFATRFFGSVAIKLAGSASVPVTVVS